MKKLAILALISLSLTACSISNEDAGQLTGAAVGGVIGHQFGNGSGQAATTALGAVIGAAVGGQVGRTMDRVDTRYVRDALEYESTGKVKRWTNPDSRITYEVQPERTYYQKDVDGSTQPCREYRSTANINGKRETVYGTACRDADGSWHVQ